MVGSGGTVLSVLLSRAGVVEVILLTAESMVSISTGGDKMVSSNAPV